MYDLAKMPRLARFLPNDVDEVHGELFALALTNQVVGACIVMNHLGLSRNDYGWMDGYDAFASALVAVSLDPQYQSRDEDLDLRLDRITAQHVAFDAIFDRYHLPEHSLLRDRIIFLLGH